MLSVFREIGSKAPILSTIFKMLIAASTAFVFFVCFIMPPIVVHDIYSTSESVKPGGNYVVITQTYKNPLTSFLCVEKAVTLHGDLVIGELKLPLTPDSEPYGNKRPGTINEVIAEHAVPSRVKDNSVLVVYKVYTYECLFRERKVRTPTVRIKIKSDFESPSPRIGGPDHFAPRHVLPDAGFGFQYEQRSLK